jgi:hypothetical protein
MLHVFYMGVAYVSHLCCKCFIWMLHMFHAYVASVSSRCCICFAMATHVFSSCFRCIFQMFQQFRTYVANVSSRCCKNRSSIAHVAVGPICSSRLLQLMGLPACAWVWRGASGRCGKPCDRGSRRSGRGTRCGTGPHMKQA